MHFGKLFSVPFLLIYFSCPALAQSTLGEALDMGAVKVLKEEYLLLLPATLSGISLSGKTRYVIKNKPDGTFSGNVTTVDNSASTGSFGTWVMDEKGKRCVDETLSSWNMTWKGCSYFFKLSGRYFRVEELDRDQRIAFIEVVSDRK